ncbi:WD40 repeat-like protein, partial [Cubamyces sp. BRFM 1775]
MYSTVALFAPHDSPLRRLAAGDARTSLVVRVGLEDTWSTTLVSRVDDESSIKALAFSPDGTCVACGNGEGTIWLLNAHTGAELQVLRRHANTSLTRSLSFSPTGKELLTGSDDGTVNLWDVATGANLNTWKAHTDWVRSVAWSPDGTLAASASDDKTVRLWRVASPEKMVVLRHSGWVFHAVFSPDGDLLSGSGDETCKNWDTRSIDWDSEADVEPIQTLKHGLMVCTVAVSSDSRLVACGLDSCEITLWTKSDGQQVRSLPGRSKVISLAFYPSGLLAAAYEGSPITLWDGSTGARVKTASNEDAAVTTSPTGKLILAVYGNELRIFEGSTGRCMRTIDHYSGVYPCAAWSPTINRFACTGRDHDVYVWKADTGELTRTFTGHSDHVTSVAFTPDEQHVLSASHNGTIR